MNRTKQLEDALLNCGSYQEALVSMQSWLADHETMQAGQRPFCIDYNSLKPQIQLQQVTSGED